MVRVRSLYVFCGMIPKLSFKKWGTLRVLDLEVCKDLMNNDIEEIVRLKWLSYLSIKDTPISELPDQIGQLQHLITLDIRGTRVRKMPASVVQLRSLKHLLCENMWFRKWVGKMTVLSFLFFF